MTTDTLTFHMEPKRSGQTEQDLVDFLRTNMGQPVTIDASNVQFLAARDLEIMISAKNQWNLDDQPFDLVNPSADFLTGLTIFGVPNGFFENEVSH